jgi:hypothetical protein
MEGSNKQTEKTVLVKIIPAGELRDLFNVRCAVLQRDLVYIFLCFKLNELNEHRFRDRGSGRNRSINLVTQNDLGHRLFNLLYIN